MITRRHLIVAAVSTPISALLCRTAQAADVVDFAGRDPSAADIVRVLRQQRAVRAAPGSPAPIRTRGLNLNADPSAASVSTPVSFNQIVFDFDSARLRPESRRTLDEIGRALGSSELAELSFRVEGHTDSVGNFAYNILLSRRRAASVQEYLETNHRIDAARLEARGKGPTELLDSFNPESAANRRVALVAFKPARSGNG